MIVVIVTGLTQSTAVRLHPVAKSYPALTNHTGVTPGTTGMSECPVSTLCHRLVPLSVHFSRRCQTVTSRKRAGHGAGQDGDDGGVTWTSYHYALGPSIALVVVGVLVLLLRWTFSHGRSLVERRPQQGASDEYGLLEVVSAPGTFVEAEVQRRTLVDAGIRATLAPTTDGPRVMVFPQEAGLARQILAGPGRKS